MENYFIEQYKAGRFDYIVNGVAYWKVDNELKMLFPELQTVKTVNVKWSSNFGLIAIFN